LETDGEAHVTNTVDFGLLANSGARLRSFKAGETIFKEGDRGDEMFVVQSGHVEIRRGNRVLETVAEKSIFGEMALIDDGPRSATVVAITDATVVPVSEKQFLFLVRETPFFALNVMRTLVGRLRTANAVV
jgi:CRP/FNR family transcriptional regulator, cyclic AMP receptor protein